MAAADASSWPAIVTSLQRVGKANWRDLVQAINRIDRILAEDPARSYGRMDYESCARYRQAVQEIARHSPQSEVEIARIAVRLSQQGLRHSDGSRKLQRRAHVGYYLVDNGRVLLEAEAGFQAPLVTRFRRLLLRYPAGFYLTAIELLTFLIVVAMLSGLNSLTPIFAGLILLLLPASQAAVDFINNLFVALLPTRALAKLDFSEGIPDDCATLVAVPALLLSEEQVHDLVLDLEIRFLANRDPNLYFALLTDAPDSDQAVDQNDGLVDLAIRLTDGLNQRYSENGRSPFFLLHRHRTYNESEGRWMGWERKRGKLLDLNRALRGGLEAFPVRVGDLSVFPGVRYVLTLDADTQLPRDSARQLIGAIAHPLNQAVVDPVSKIVIEGYGILQPRVGISIQSASRSR
jgi:cyclic beta-1,2-glucan synthetase